MGCCSKLISLSFVTTFINHKGYKEFNIIMKIVFCDVSILCGEKLSVRVVRGRIPFGRQPVEE
jgi:hypothetical protein